MNGEDKKDSNSLKITLIGDSGVGKTCIIFRFISNEFSSNTLTTDGVSYSKKEIIYNDKKLQLDLWDTAGQEQYRSLGKHFYKDSFVVILVYNITVKETFDNLKNIWLEDVVNYGEEYKVLAIVGNKCDLYEQEAVSEQEAREFAEENNALFMLVSAKDGTNIDLLFDSCVKKYFEPKFQIQIEDVKKRDEYSVVIRNKNKKRKTITEENNEKQRKCCQ